MQKEGNSFDVANFSFISYTVALNQLNTTILKLLKYIKFCNIEILI